MNTKALRQKVLDLAIHGKLVPQNPNDESATVLLEKIRAEKAEKIKKGELKADKKDSFIFVGSDKRHYEQFADGTVKDIEDEIPFEVPDGWAWCRLNELADIARGGSPRPIENYITDSPDGINWIKIGDTAPESKYIESAKEKIKPEGQKHSRFVHEGDFLLTNSMSFGRPYILNINGCIHDGWLVFANIKECVIKDYLYYALSSDYIYASFSMVAAGSTVKNLKSDTVKQVLFPLPPIKTQEKIVESIEKSFTQIDILDNEKLDLQAAIKQAKSKILDLAIHGKLVPQDPNDEPAEELLKRIATSDNRPYEKVEDETAYEIPKNWCLSKIKDVCSVIMGQSPEGAAVSDDKNGIEFHQGKICFGEKYLEGSSSFTNHITKIAPKDSVLLCVRAPVGIVNITQREICIGRGLCAVNPKYDINSDFWFYWLKSLQSDFEQKATGTTFRAISIDVIKNQIIPIPPVEEQKSIVNKIDELYTLLDQIQNNLI